MIRKEQTYLASKADAGGGTAMHAAQAFNDHSARTRMWGTTTTYFVVVVFVWQRVRMFVSIGLISNAFICFFRLLV
jgi:hypothetical protein